MSLEERVKREGNPVIDGDTATFVWVGDDPPQLVGDFNLWGFEGYDRPDRPVTLQPVRAGLWMHTITLPEDAYIEYCFFRDIEDEDSRVLDPHNTHTVDNGFGNLQNTFHMPAYRPTPYIADAENYMLRGTLTQHTVAHGVLPEGDKRRVWLYAPPTDQAVPLLLVYDGNDYLSRAYLPQIVDRLIDEDRIPPLALAMVENAGRARFMEYNASETALMAVMRLVLPLARAELKLIDPARQPGAYGVLGASMGGLMALYTGLRLSPIFGRVIAQSGAYQSGMLSGLPSLTETLLNLLSRPDLRLWQDVGRYEWLIEENRHMNALLRQRGYAPIYREFNAGHNYPAWRDQLPDALVAVFGEDA